MQRVNAAGRQAADGGDHWAMADLRKIFGGREPLYEKGDASVNTSGKTVKQAAAELRRWLKA